jgi:hypothetical protein
MVFERNPYCSIFEDSNPKACSVFSDKINHKILKNCNCSDLDAKWKELVEKSKILEHKQSGESAMYIVPDGDVSGFVAIYGGTYDDADIKAMVDFDASVSDVAEYVSCSASKGYSRLKYISQYTHRKETVYIYRQTSQCGIAKNWQDCHLCTCRGNVIIATSEDLARSAIDNILDNKTKVALGNRRGFQVSVNTEQIIGDILSWRGDSSAQLYNIGNMKPIDIYSTCGNNKCTLYVTFDNASIAELGKLIFSIFGSEGKSSDSDTDTLPDEGEKEVEKT